MSFFNGWYGKKVGAYLLGEQETAIAVLQEQIRSLGKRLGSLELDVQQKFDRLEKKLDEALRGRPTWAVTIVVSSLLTVSTGLIVFLVTQQ